MRDPGQDKVPDAAFLSSTMPPLQLGFHLLRKRATTRERTWSSVEPALTWLAENLTAHPHVNLPGEGYRDGVSLDGHLQCARTSLIDGVDAYHEYYQQGFSKVAFGVICCPHAHRSEIGCPLPPS